MITWCEKAFTLTWVGLESSVVSLAWYIALQTGLMYPNDQPKFCWESMRWIESLICSTWNMKVDPSGIWGAGGIQFVFFLGFGMNGFVASFYPNHQQTQIRRIYPGNPWCQTNCWRTYLIELLSCFVPKSFDCVVINPIRNPPAFHLLELLHLGFLSLNIPWIFDDEFNLFRHFRGNRNFGLW